MIVGLLLFGGLAGTVGPATATSAVPSPPPLHGGVVTTASGDLSILDPAAAGALAANDGVAAQILGALFLPSAGNDEPVADLATTYRMNRLGTSITFTLRRGARFSDGTAFNAAAVIWNLRRTSISGAFDAGLLAGITKMTATGPESVTIDFATPDFAFITACVTTAICDMASPTSFDRLGPAAFAAAPVGAGPFRVTRNVAPRVVLAKNDSYWDARHVYLSRWNLVDLGDDPGTIYQSLIEDTVQGASFDQLATAPSVLFVASGNHNVVSRTTPNLDYGFLPLDVSSAPFSDKLAREAIDYCTNRTAIAKSVAQGYATPAYVLAGSADAYLPKSGAVREAEKLMPYRFDIAQGSALVSQLGGLDFELESTGGESGLVAAALAAQWLVCGIHAVVVQLTDAQLESSLTSNGYQAAYLEVPGGENPAASMALETPASPLHVPGYTDSALTTLAQSASATNSSSRLLSLWHQIWFEENSDAIDIPVISSGAMIVVSHCLRGIGYSFGLSFLHASLACPA